MTESESEQCNCLACQLERLMEEAGVEEWTLLSAAGEERHIFSNLPPIQGINFAIESLVDYSEHFRDKIKLQQSTHDTKH